MRLGYELVKEQLFFRKELRERLLWFINLRWIVAGLASIGVVFARALGQQIAFTPIIIVIGVVYLYNIFFFFVWRRLELIKPQQTGHFNFFAHAQISLDLLALYSIIYFTGGILSPILIFVIFHVILAGILLSLISAVLYGVTCILAVGFLDLMQKVSFLPVQPILFHEFLHPHGIDFPSPLVTYIVFSAAMLITVFLVSSVKLSLKEKGRELLYVSKELEDRNSKLTGLYEMVKHMCMSTELQGLMDSATRNAAHIMGVKACSIKLLDDRRKRLRFSSTYGLSEDYLAKGAIDIEKSPINRRIIRGSIYSIGEIGEKDYFQYPEDIRKEGISSMVCLPLRVERSVLGVFCVYSDISHHFNEEDIRFFSLMADLTALTIENLKSEVNKTWFLQKAAHQLRSPLNAIFSMLELLSKNYLGAMNEDQTRTVKRCEKRIQILNKIVDDLLSIGMRRMDQKDIHLKPVDILKVIKPIIGFYKAQAKDAGLNITFEIDDSIPKISATERMVDDLITNLISNAIKYTLSGGSISVVLAKDENGLIRFEVSDSGIGIPEKEMPNLFSEFFRATNAKDTAEEGTGLGLVIVKEIVEGLSGSVSVESREGKGTSITCIMPGAQIGLNQDINP